MKDDSHPSQVVTADKIQPKTDNSFLDDPESIALRRTLGEQESIELAPGLVAELFTIAADDPGSPDQSLKVSLSMLPFQSDTDNSPLQSEAAFEALVKTAKVVLAVKHLEVDFEICPPSRSTPDPNTIDTQPDIKTGRFGSASKLFTSRYPEHMAGLLGAANPPPTHAGLNDNERYLRDLLKVLKPARLKLSSVAQSIEPEHHSPVNKNLPCAWEPSPTRPLVFAKRMPLAMAGNDLFTQPGQVLNYLEIGPWIPISEQCGTEHWCPFTKWQVKVLAINMVRRPPPPPSDSSREEKTTSALPGILWDPAFGFVSMLQGESSTIHGSRDVLSTEVAQPPEPTRPVLKTRIVLLCDTTRDAARFANQVVKLAALDPRDPDLARRFKRFQKSIYFVSPETGSRVQKVFDKEKEGVTPGKKVVGADKPSNSVGSSKRSAGKPASNKQNSNVNKKPKRQDVPKASQKRLRETSTTSSRKK